VKYLVGESNLGSLVESQTEPQCKQLTGKAVRESERAACAPACATPTDPDLARVVAAWPALPDAIKRAVLALIGGP
jgi:hypothetical protein